MIRNGSEIAIRVMIGIIAFLSMVNEHHFAFRRALGLRRRDVVALRLLDHHRTVIAGVVAHANNHADQNRQQTVVSPIRQTGLIACIANTSRPSD